MKNKRGKPPVLSLPSETPITPSTSSVSRTITDDDDINATITQLTDVSLADNNSVFSTDKKISMEDFEKLEELGVGNGGVVTRVRHKQSGRIMAQKLVRLEVKNEIHKRIVTELKLLEDCKHDNIVGYYGTFAPPQQQEIVICMEHMNGRSLDVLLKTAGRLPQNIIGVISVSVVRGCRFLHEQKKVMHRDIKPSNILVNDEGKVKLCDFGVSANLINSIANSFVGTRSYMAPERLTGTQEYTIKSDVWALGITLIEFAIGFYPVPGRDQKTIKDHIDRCPILDATNEQTFEATFKNITYARECVTGLMPTQNMAIFELLDHIVSNEPPKLFVEEDNFSEDFVEYANSCLRKSMHDRPTFAQLSDFKFIKDSESTFLQDTDYFAKFMKFAIEKYI